MFIGQYFNKMDAKKRISIPVRFRESLGKTAIITRGLDQCLFLYSREAWQQFANKISQLPLSQTSGRDFARLLFSSASEVEIDNLGRILIPDFLKNYALLNKEVVLIGAGERVEIWAREKWEKYQELKLQDFNDMVSSLKEFGI